MTEEQIRARAEVVRVTTAMLEGQLSYLQGARWLSSLRHSVGSCEDAEEDFIIFVAIDSETDHLPLGKDRDLWAKSALERLEPEITQAEAWAKESGERACENLNQRFAPNHSMQQTPYRGG